MRHAAWDRHRWAGLAVVVAAGLAGPVTAGAESFAGTYADDQIRLDLSASPDGGYAGTLTRGGNTYPVQATASGSTLSGTFVAAGKPFPFTATLAAGRLAFQSGQHQYSLAAAANPLDGPITPAATPAVAAVGTPAAAAVARPPAVDAPATIGDFQVLAATPSGKTLFRKLPAAATVELALTQTADSLAHVLDAKPVLGVAFADAKDHRKGGVSLTGKLAGRDVRGLIFCGLDGTGGATATVVLAATDAPKDDVAALFAAMPAAPPTMRPHVFPDGSGSVDLPDGWTTPNTTAAHGIFVHGPAGQSVVVCNIITVSDPNCRLVRNSRQLYALQLQNYKNQQQRYQQMIDLHRRFPNTPAPTAPTAPVEPDPDPNVAIPAVTFCPYCDGPEAVLKTYYPISEAKQRRAGGPYTTLDKVMAVFPSPPDPAARPGSRCGVAYIAVTDHDGPTATHARALNRIYTAHIIDGESWQLMFCNMRGPDATFDRDLPVMAAIMNGVKVDTNVTGQEVAAEGAALRKMGDETFQAMLQRGRAFQDQQAASFQSHERQIAAQEQATHDSASDYIEYIGGVRHVYDSSTGRMLDVDLFNSTAIVNGLNDAANDPARFVQIPLRYER